MFVETSTRYVGSPWVVIGALFAGIALLAWRRANDPYGTFHLTLNKLHGEDLTSDPATEWLNMGLWKDTDVFPEACEALALKLVRAARYKENGNILDVGYGSGESLIFHLTHPAVPRPRHLTGITSLKDQFQRSEERTRRLLPTLGPAEPVVDLYHGDAVYRPGSLEHPLDPSAAAEPFDAILALDCAYHFDTREEFLRQSHSRLASGGRIALADLCFSSDGMNRRARFVVSLFGLLPRRNIVTPEQYVQSLQEMGFVDVEIEDVSGDVFPGFARFLSSRGGPWGIVAGVIRWLAKTGLKFVVVSASKP